MSTRVPGSARSSPSGGESMGRRTSGGGVLGGGVDGGDYGGGVGLELEVGGVHGSELETVEEGRGAFGLDLSGGEGVDDDGEGDLDGFAVFEGGELDVATGDEVAARGRGVAEGGVALVEASVEVAVGGLVERWGVALETVGL